MSMVTNEGWITSSRTQVIAATTVATINTVAAVAMALKNYEIAKGYLDISRRMNDFWWNSYQPCEARTVASICADERYEPQYDLVAGRFVASVRSQFAKVKDEIRCLSRYCTGLTAAMYKDMAIQEAKAVADTQNYGYRYEDTRKEAKDDVWFNRRIQMFSLGRGLTSQALSYGQAASGIYGTLGQQAGQGAAGAFGMLGYALNRNVTEYPTNPGYNTRSYQGYQQQNRAASPEFFDAPGLSPGELAPAPSNVLGLAAPGGNTVISMRQLGDQGAAFEASRVGTGPL